MKANMIANMQMAMAGTKKKKKALRAKQNLKKLLALRAKGS